MCVIIRRRMREVENPAGRVATRARLGRHFVSNLGWTLFSASLPLTNTSWTVNCVLVPRIFGRTEKANHSWVTPLPPCSSLSCGDAFFQGAWSLQGAWERGRGEGREGGGTRCRAAAPHPVEVLFAFCGLAASWGEVQLVPLSLLRTREVMGLRWFQPSLDGSSSGVALPWTRKWRQARSPRNRHGFLLYFRDGPVELVCPAGAIGLRTFFPKAVKSRSTTWTFGHAVSHTRLPLARKSAQEDPQGQVGRVALCPHLRHCGLSMQAQVHLDPSVHVPVLEFRIILPECLAHFVVQPHLLLSTQRRYYLAGERG